MTFWKACWLGCVSSSEKSQGDFSRNEWIAWSSNRGDIDCEKTRPRLTHQNWSELISSTRTPHRLQHDATVTMSWRLNNSQAWATGPVEGDGGSHLSLQRSAKICKDLQSTCITLYHSSSTSSAPQLFCVKQLFLLFSSSFFMSPFPSLPIPSHPRRRLCWLPLK